MAVSAPAETRRLRLPRLSLRGWLITAAVVGVIVAIRIALPHVIRDQLIEQGNAALIGKLDVGDVDLSLLRGGITLRDVSLRDAEAGPDDPPLVGWDELYVDIGWLSLLRGVVRIEDVNLVGLGLNVARLEDGAIVIPRVREEEAGAEQPEEGAPWPVLIDRIKLGRGRVVLRDDLPGERTLLEAGLPSIELKKLRLQPEEGGEPGRGTIEVHVRDGVVRIEPSIDARADGFALDVDVDAENVPLDRLHVHAGLKIWSELKGRLNGHLRILSAPDAGLTISGALAVDGLEIRVPKEDEPAVAWRRLEVEAEQIDLTALEARIKRVSLDGAFLLARPREPVPLPVMGREPEQPRKASTPKKGASTPRKDGSTPKKGASTKKKDAVAAPEDAKAEKPWKWRVDTVEVKDSRVKTLLEPPPLEVDVVQAKVTDLDSAPGSTAHVTLTLREGEGTIDVEGDAVLEPVSLDARVRLAALGLARLVTASSPMLAVSGGTLAGELGVKYNPEALSVTGKLDVADLAAKLPEGEDFALEWRQLGVDIGEVRVPFAGAGREGAGEPLDIRLAALRLASPRVVLTRGAEGFILPGSGGVAARQTAPAGAESGSAPTPAPAETAAEAGKGEPPPASLPGPRVLLDTLAIEDGALTFTDRSVTPVYEGRVRRIQLDAKQVDVMAGLLDQVSLRLDAPGRGHLEVRGTAGKEETNLDIELKGLRLPQFNAYATPATGYAVTGGAATLHSKIQWSADRYTAKNQIELDGLELGGSEGEALFRDQFGISIGLALALLRDPSGRISLGIPLKGDRASGASVELAPIIAQAVSKAIIGAITSPLKLIGSFSREGDRIEGLTPAPIHFPPGHAELDEESREQVEELGIVLARLPHVRLTLRGMAGREDVRALAEEAVLADLEGEGFLAGSWSNLMSGGARSAIRDALRARAKGEVAELDTEDREDLEKMLAEKRPSSGDLERLAQARAEAARTELAKQKVAVDRLEIVSPAIDPEQGATEVAVSVAG